MAAEVHGHSVTILLFMRGDVPLMFLHLHRGFVKIGIMEATDLVLEHSRHIRTLVDGTWEIGPIEERFDRLERRLELID
jgi:hypothetical protein